MIGVTIGVGEGWREMAVQAATRMAETTGLRCEIVSVDDFGCAHPSWLKCHITRLFPDEDSFLVFDCDILPIRSWDPEGLFEQLGRPFCAVPEPNANDEVLAECAEWKLGFPDTYLNGGLLIFGREHQFIWDRVWDYHPEGGRWLEQTALNRVLADQQVEVCRLPRRFNVLAHRGRLMPIYSRCSLRDAVNLHLCASGTIEKLREHVARFSDYIQSGRAGRDRLQLLRDLPKGSVGAELGVFAGEFSEQILSIVQPAKLTLVDFFDGVAHSGNVDGRNIRPVDLRQVGDWFEADSYRSRGVTVHRGGSVSWLKQQPDNSLDWIYVDTTHEFEQTLAELRASWRVVKPGGIIAGHDFSRAFPGVIAAVTQFLREVDADLDLYEGDLLASYAIRKEVSNG